MITRDQLIIKHIPFVHYMALKLSPKRWYHDLVTTGYGKLITIVDEVLPTYPDKHNDAYICRAIANAMLDWLELGWVKELTGINNDVALCTGDYINVDFDDFMTVKLNEMEKKILDLIMEGNLKKDIAKVLNISAVQVSRVSVHIKSLTREYMS